MIKNWFHKIRKYKHTKIISLLGIMGILLNIFSYERSINQTYPGVRMVTPVERLFTTDIFIPIIFVIIFSMIAYRLYHVFLNKNAALGAGVISLSFIIMTAVYVIHAFWNFFPTLSMSLGVISLIILLIGSILLFLSLLKLLDKHDPLHLLLTLSSLLMIFNIYIIGFFVVLWMLYVLENKEDI